jgi:hypothetical protein
MKNPIVIIVSTFLCMSAWAQQEVGTWSIQPKIGLNMAGIVTYDHDTDVDGESGVRLAPVFALEAECQLARNFALVGGVQYSNAGRQRKGEVLPLQASDDQQD